MKIKLSRYEQIALRTIVLHTPECVWCSLLAGADSDELREALEGRESSEEAVLAIRMAIKAGKNALTPERRAALLSYPRLYSNTLAA